MVCVHTQSCVLLTNQEYFCTSKPSKDFNNLMEGTLHSSCKLARNTDWTDSSLSLLRMHPIARRKTTHLRLSKIMNSVPKQTFISKPHLSRKIFPQLVKKLVFVHPLSPSCASLWPVPQVTLVTNLLRCK